MKVTQIPAFGSLMEGGGDPAVVTSSGHCPTRSIVWFSSFNCFFSLMDWACVRMLFLAHAHERRSACRGVSASRRQLAEVASLLPPCGSWGSNSALQAWQQAPVAPGPSQQPTVWLSWTAFLVSPVKPRRGTDATPHLPPPRSPTPRPRPGWEVSQAKPEVQGHRLRPTQI